MISRRSFIASATAASCFAAVPFHYSKAADRPIAEHVIIIKKFRFEADARPILPGDTITWINRDIVPHTATANDESWDTGLIEPGQKKAITVSEDFSRDYYCLFHPMMKATLDIGP